MANIKLVLEYDGYRYHGWQRQPNLPTIQGTIEDAILKITQRRVTVIGSGRTDAGVHAEGQVANFITKARLRPDEWTRALNSLLPDDVVVLSAQKVSDRFHARSSAIGKVYRYRILNRPHPPAIGRQYVWTVYSPLNLNRMRAAAKGLLGRHDFSAFRGSGPSTRTAVCHIRHLDWVQRQQELVMTIEADHFLQQMVRTIVGTLVEVGKGRRHPRELEELVQKKDRRFSGPTAPPQGLSLIRVIY